MVVFYLGSGTSAITAMAVLTDGQMIVGDGTTDPVAESGATLRTSIGVGTTDDVKFANITGSNNISASGNLSITGNITGSSNLGANGDLYIGGNVTASAEFKANTTLIGTSIFRNNLFNTTLGSALQVEGTTAQGGSIMVTRNTGASAGDFPFIALCKSRGSSLNSNTILANNDYVGSISFQGNDGAEFVEAASIRSYVNGTPGSNDMPGALEFRTTADGGASSTLAMTIDSSQDATFAGNQNLTGDLTIGAHANGNTTGHANLNLAADANEGADSYLNFTSGTTTRGSISYDHNQTAADQTLSFNVGDDAVNAIQIKGNGHVILTQNPAFLGVGADVASNWGSTFDVIGVGHSAAIFCEPADSADRGFHISNNIVYDGSGAHTIYEDQASTISQKGGDITFKTTGSVAPSVDLTTIGGTERMRIRNDGQVMIGKSTTSGNVAGARFSTTGNELTVDAGTVMFINRQSNDGDIISLRQADSEEGTISVSGGTVAYNAFLGSHWSELSGSSFPVNSSSLPNIKKGTVVSTIDEITSGHGNRLAKFKITDTENDTRVYGVFGNWNYDDDTGEIKHASIHSLGAGLVRVTGSCVGGDLLVSAGDGCAKVNNSGTLQTVIGKVTANTSGSATEDRLIPVVLYCG